MCFRLIFLLFSKNCEYISSCSQMLNWKTINNIQYIVNNSDFKIYKNTSSDHLCKKEMKFNSRGKNNLKA